MNYLDQLKLLINQLKTMDTGDLSRLCLKQPADVTELLAFRLIRDVRDAKKDEMDHWGETRRPIHIAHQERN